MLNIRIGVYPPSTVGSRGGVNGAQAPGIQREKLQNLNAVTRFFIL